MTIATTGVGSLPHSDAEDAARFVLGTAGIPYLPQLPARHPEEGMLAQWGDGLCGCGPGGLGLAWGAPIGPCDEAFGGAERLLDHLPADTPALKVQATGPVTLAAAMAISGHPGPDLLDCVVDGLSQRVAGHLDSIRRRLPEAEITLVLDEPALGASSGWGGVPMGDAYEAVAAVMAAAPVPAGIHCCGDADWEAVARLRPAALSLDVAALGISFLEGAAELAIAVSAGTRMIWGAVPVGPPPLPDVDAIVARIRRAEGILVLAGADIRRLDDAWVSPACGMAAATIEGATAIAARVADVAAELDGQQNTSA